MNVTFTRKCFEPGGFVFEMLKGTDNPCKPLPRDVALVKGDGRGGRQFVTWAEIHAARTERQNERIYRKRQSQSDVRAVRVVVWLNQCFPFEGWHGEIDGCHGSNIHEWIRRRRGGDNPFNLCRLYPVTPYTEDYDDWMPLFAEQYPDIRKIPHRLGERQYPRGVVYCWAICKGGYIDDLVKIKP